MKSILSIIGITLTLGLMPFSASGAPGQEAQRIPFKFAVGNKLYQANCASCHGVDSKGTDQGPPLLHRFYEPNHHNDASFIRAVTSGVRQHHWGFGDMPPVEGLTERDAKQITRYLRWWQQQNGVF